MNFKLSDNAKFNAIWSLLNVNYNEANDWLVEYGICEVYDDYAVVRNFAESTYERVYYTKNDETDSVELGDRVRCYFVDVTEGEMLPHTYGPWNVLREPTHKVQGFQERKCTVCGRLDTAVIPCLEGMSTGAIIAIIVGSVVVLGGVGTVVYFQIKKKKVAASANAKTED